jgi:hypothetical protein
VQVSADIANGNRIKQCSDSARINGVEGMTYFNGKDVLQIFSFTLVGTDPDIAAVMFKTGSQMSKPSSSVVQTG